MKEGTDGETERRCAGGEEGTRTVEIDPAAKLKKTAPEIAAHASLAGRGIQKRVESGQATSKRIGEALKMLEIDGTAAGLRFTAPSP
jgi:hypothetical protein